MWGSLYNFFKRIKNILVFLLFIAFGFSILAHIVSPETTILFAPFGLGFLPFILGTLIIGILYIRRNKWISLTAFLLIALALKYLPGTISLNFNQKQEGLKVMSWNVKNFDLYNWTKNKDTREKMFQLIDSIDPDVLCLQEFYTDNNEFDNIKALKQLGYSNYSFFPAYKQKDGSQWGLIILSKFELKNGKAIALNPKKSSINQAVSTQLSYAGKTYTIFNAHLQSIHLDYTDLDYIQDVKEELKFLDKIKSWRIVYKIMIAYKSRTEQLERLLIEQSKYENIILCCDLNDIPASHAYHILSENYQDAFKKKGLGLSNTISIGLPVYRIDYIFSSPNLVVNCFNKIENTYSDHHIVLSHIE
jgi:endonuclease/exonuclease/phosphatase family metal-dependent hydrolase